MFFELNATVYSRWPCAPGDNTKRTRPSGLATVTSAAAGSDKQNRANGHRMVVFIDTVIPHSQLPRELFAQYLLKEVERQGSGVHPASFRYA